MLLRNQHKPIFITNDKFEKHKNLYLQYHTLSEVTQRKTFDDFLGLIPSSTFFNELEDSYGMFVTSDDFDFLTYSSFYSFFISNRIDVPNYFNNTKSVRRGINNIPLLKFNNYFMRKGLRYRTLYLINSSLRLLINDFRVLKDLNFVPFSSWKDFFLITTFSKDYKLSFDKNEVISYGNIQTKYFKDIITLWDLKKILFLNITQLTSIFSFYIYKVDKKIFKNTRGKSGKYTFIWKYVSTYKRPSLVMFWLLKELRILPGRTIRERLSNLIRLFVLNPNKTWAYKVKKFSNNYVYRNCRNTLAEHYRTVKK